MTCRKDPFTEQQRSEIMRRVRARDTSPEMRVRSLIHRMGYRFRLHRADLPGTPDIVLPRYRLALFVNGCFWHRHAGCKRASTPATRLDYWLPKFQRTLDRDQRNHEALKNAGWSVATIWECETHDEESLRGTLGRAISGAELARRPSR